MMLCVLRCLPTVQYMFKQQPLGNTRNNTNRNPSILDMTFSEEAPFTRFALPTSCIDVVE